MAVVVAAVFYIAAYWRIMPPYLLWHAALVRIGVFEILGGVGLLLSATRRAVAWGLVAPLIAVFPANPYMACIRSRRRPLASRRC